MASLEEIEHAMKIAAKVVAMYGGAYLPIFKRLRSEFLKAQEAEETKMLAIQMLGVATPYLQKYTYKVVYSWMDNDDAGASATSSLNEFIKTQENLRHRPLNDVYKKHKDVNAWYMAKLRL